jgi:Sulfotransferase family
MAYYGVHELVPGTAEPRYIVFLRDPVERVISLYFYLKYTSTNYWHREIVNHDWTIEDWLAHSEALWMHNGQLRHLLLGSYDEVERERTLTADHLVEGKRRLGQFWFVGLTEAFAPDARYLYGKLDFRRFHPRVVVNATPKKDVVSPAVREQIIAYNELDMELYEYGRALRRKILLRRPLAYHFQKLRADVRRFMFERKASGKRENERAASVLSRK